LISMVKLLVVRCRVVRQLLTGRIGATLPV